MICMTSKLALIHDNKQEPFGKHNVFLQAWEKWLRACSGQAGLSYRIIWIRIINPKRIAWQAHHTLLGSAHQLHCC